MSLRRPGTAAGAAALLLLLLAATGAAAAQPFGVGIVAPAAGQPVFGSVEVVLEVRGAPARRVELYLDGRLVGELDAPPWRLRIEVGQDNVPRVLRAIAWSEDGRRDEAELTLPAIRVDEVVELPLVQLYVTASREGEPVLDLERAEFGVVDGGRRQRLVTFERGDVPLTAVLLIDSSLSMRGERIRSALAGARAFVEAMAPLDEAKVLVVSDQVIRRTPFGSDSGLLLRDLDGALARGGTAILDHLYLALRELESRQGRRVVVLLSDGVDVDSLLGTRELLPVVGRSPAQVYWIRLGGADPQRQHRSIWREPDEHAAELAGLAGLVERSGGRIFDLASAEWAEEVFREVLEELRNQYVLGYYADVRRHDGSWHEVEVETSRSGVRLRTRAGYFDD